MAAWSRGIGSGNRNFVIETIPLAGKNGHFNEGHEMPSNIRTTEGDIPAPILSQLDSRDAAVWFAGSDFDQINVDKVSALFRLPWQIVLSEISDDALVSELEKPEDPAGLLVKRRGLMHIVEADPAETVLPPRHLAVLLLNGRDGQRRTGLAALTRRLTMLSDLRKRSLKQLVVVVTGKFEIPADLKELWADGFRTILTFVSSDPDAADRISDWSDDAHRIGLIELGADVFSSKLVGRFLEGRDGSLVVRIRDQKGETSLLDVAGLDDPERPLLGTYELLGNESLSLLLPGDLTAAEVDSFFSDTSASWRPYAAGMPWERIPQAWQSFRSRLRSLDKDGPEANRIFYITAESGAGATVFLRDLAFRAAVEGYPVLVAQRGLIPGSALEMTNFLTRLTASASELRASPSPLYEAPSVIVFDQEHWSGRENELASFARELERSGRRACILFATGPYVGLGILTEPRFVELASLTHQMANAQAQDLGRHLNKYLAPHGSARNEHEWRAFFDSSSVQGGNGIAAFWIVLSFWLQRQIDLGETVQSRVYKQFAGANLTIEVKCALLRIAAFSTVRMPLPDALLPEASGWTMAEKLSDLRKELGALGLIRVNREENRLWALAHDLLGRYLLTGLFYDYEARCELGFEAAANPEHLRFLVLKGISFLPEIQRPNLRETADAFAVSVFKIDPDHGHATLSPFWSEVLEALDQMPRSVRTTSRTFLHHTAISRRRIAADPEVFPMGPGERVSLLRRAVEDIEAALRLDTDFGGETEINLYNSLAHAYHDLADSEQEAGEDMNLIITRRAAANEATRRAYGLNPDNSFVVETYARNLLSQSKSDPEIAIPNALEVLNLVYVQMARPASETRRNALGRIAEDAFELLLSKSGSYADSLDTSTETGAIAAALSELAKGVDYIRGTDLKDYPTANRLTAAALLAAPALAGNVQAVKMRYMLAVIDEPLDFGLHLNLLEALQGSGPAFTPQMHLELAILLFQKERPHEGDRMFKQLRGLWRRGDYFVEVPPRLHWLLDSSAAKRRQVRAKVGMNSEGRAFAKVYEFQGTEAPFRSTEFGQPRAGTAIAAYVSFGHNGPLLRPLTAPQR